MSYKISVEQFKNGKMFVSQGKFSHKSGNRFKLFPFATHSNTVLGLGALLGTFLCLIEGKVAQKLEVTDLLNTLKKDIKIEPGKEERFNEVVRQLFFSSDGTIRPLNLMLIEQNTTSETSENRIAEYLVSVLGDRTVLKHIVEEAKKRIEASSNVLEKLVLSKFKFDIIRPEEEGLKYYQVTHSLNDVFEEDFSYILENPNRSREYLIMLLEWYYFTYTAQTSLQLNRFLEGERDRNIPLYFCLEWEKTSQSRLCFTEGWQKLQRVLEKMFAHVIVLEILNHTEAGSEVVDYCRIAEMIKAEVTDIEISKQIDAITDCYRNAITDCPEMTVLQKKDSSLGYTDASIHFLYDSVKTQFDNTGRERPYNSYANKFIDYCHKYLKNRGRSGLMLNLTEETLIFLTKLCIKNQEQMRLNDVFDEFERRGVFLDSYSKEQVAGYYEKLNLIEKKSDSGDAKYVKRIL